MAQPQTHLFSPRRNESDDIRKPQAALLGPLANHPFEYMGWTLHKFDTFVCAANPTGIP